MSRDAIDARIEPTPQGGYDMKAPVNRSTQAEGVKHDAAKARYDLVPPLSLEAVVRVLTYGAKKYAPGNWRLVPDARSRYFAAAMRHTWAWWRGEPCDPESGEHHLAHAICCLMFAMEPELESGT